MPACRKLCERMDNDDNWPQRLSGGEQQRVALARALLAKPDWIFLDEATASLDPDAEADLYRRAEAAPAERDPGVDRASAVGRRVPRIRGWCSSARRASRARWRRPPSCRRSGE